MTHQEASTQSNFHHSDFHKQLFINHNSIMTQSTQYYEAMGIETSRRNRVPRPLTDNERQRLEEFVDAIHYSSRYVILSDVQSLPTQLTSYSYNDSEYEYRHVQIPKQMLKIIPADYHDKAKGTLKLLWEEEWRAMGITQSLGWEHYEVHEPEPHILLFKYVCSDPAITKWDGPVLTND